MEKKRSVVKKRLSSFLVSYPQEVIEALFELQRNMEESLYLVGGTVRDLLIGRSPKDIDITLASGAYEAASDFSRLLGGGALVPLGKQEDDTCRVVFKGVTIDFADFRKGARTIEKDLALRDFTVNSMAYELYGLMDQGSEAELIDPLGGFEDINSRLLRGYPSSFQDDPLRLLRAYRLRATLGLELVPELRDQVKRDKELIREVAPERVLYEMNGIVESPGAHKAFLEMAENGLLFQILPELEAGVGMEQPQSHHLDVFGHGLEALKWMEKIQDHPKTFFPDSYEAIATYLKDTRTRRNLKWAALVHDLGKPAVQDIRKDKDDRITFYNHDQVGKYLFLEIAKRLRWSGEDSEQVAGLIEMHMHPFHLCNVQRKEQVSRRAILKLCKKAGSHLPGLFLLAMADNLASQGEMAPEGMGSELNELFCTLQETIDRIIQPVLSGPGLLNGNDLKKIFGLSPGPIFSKILEALELARVDGLVGDRDDAIDWVGGYIKTLSSSPTGLR